ncbi:hypothetical protein ACFL0P_04705 [Candidatus Omnitrophota bacterium]
MIKLNFKNNTGFILIATYMVIAILVILATGFAIRSIGEQRVINKERDLAQAFWLAEAGIDRAMAEIPNTPLSGTLDAGSYSTQTATTTNPIRFLITSTGGVPGTDETNPDNIVRKIRAIVEQPANDADPNDITAAITSTGDVTVGGGADVIGDIDANATLDDVTFEETFGISKETMKQSSSNSYTDPANDVTPVAAITWVDVTAGNVMRIASGGWTGSGILVVNGDFKMSGGTFDGILYVIGSLDMAVGNANINGAIFVECGDDTTTVLGACDVAFDADDISDAFDFLPSDLPPYIISWQEE